jgi:hypothetical protein
VRENPTGEHIPELYAICREYEATLQVTSDPDEKWRLYRILQELRACIIQIESQ